MEYIRVSDFNILPTNTAQDNTIGAITLQAAVEQAAAEVGVFFDLPGTYQFDVRPVSPLHPIQFKNVNGLEIVGLGREATVLKRHPLGNYNHFGDIHLIRLEKISRGSVHDLTLHGSFGEFVNPLPNAHVHNLYLTGCQDVHIYNLVSKKARGDGLYLIRLDAGEISTKRIRVDHVLFDQNNRAGIANQRGLSDVLIQNCTFLTNRLDIEPSGAPSIDGYTIDNCIFEAAGGYPLQVGGASGSAPLRNLRITNTTVRNGGFWLIHSEDVLVDNLTLTQIPGSVGLTLRGYLKGVKLTNSHIKVNADYIDANGQPATSSEACAVRVLGYNVSSDIRIEGNPLIEQMGKAAAISVELATETTIRNNRINGTGYANGVQSVWLYDDGVVRSGMTVDGNRIDNFAAGVFWGNYNVPLPMASCQENKISNCAKGISLRRIPQEAIQLIGNQFHNVVDPIYFTNS